MARAITGDARYRQLTLPPIDEAQYFANTLPEDTYPKGAEQDKANLIDKLQQKGHSVCYVGDGYFAIALKKAHVSVSMREYHCHLHCSSGDDERESEPTLLLV